MRTYVTIFKELVYKVVVKLNSFFAYSFLHPPICYINQFPAVITTIPEFFTPYFCILKSIKSF